MSQPNIKKTKPRGGAFSKLIRLAILPAVVIFCAFLNAAAQQTQLLKRTIYKTDTVELHAGGTIAVVGAPVGSITIEGWQNNSVEISADIEMQAATEADLALLAQVNGYVIDDALNRVSIQSVGTFDKRYVKRTVKKFPKNLLTMPLRIDYRIKVPLYSDLEIDGGKGDFSLQNVEGAMRINFLETNALLRLTGGAVNGNFGSGAANIEIATPAWRGRGAEFQMINGAINVFVPAALNADLNLSILRGGQIENALAFLKPRDRTKFTDKQMTARAGSGGAPLSFTVGDGALKIAEIEP